MKKRKKGGSTLWGGADERERERDSTTPRFYDSAVGPDGYVERPVLHTFGGNVERSVLRLGRPKTNVERSVLRSGRPKTNAE